jgi:hypothetical protein
MDRRIGLALPAVALGVALLAAGSLATGTSSPVAAEASLIGSLSVDGAPVESMAAAAGNSSLNCTRTAANGPIHCTASNPAGLKKIDVGAGLPAGAGAAVAHTTTRAGTSAAAAPGARWTGSLSLRVDAGGTPRTERDLPDRRPGNAATQDQSIVGCATGPVQFDIPADVAGPVGSTLRVGLVDCSRPAIAADVRSAAAAQATSARTWFSLQTSGARVAAAPAAGR